MDAINAWAVGGYYTKLIRESMDAWIGLHQHLLRLAITERVPWSYVQVKLDHHVEELETLCNMQDSRLQVLCANYVYLRDGHAGSWHLTSLQYNLPAAPFMSNGISNRLNSCVGCLNHFSVKQPAHHICTFRRRGFSLDQKQFHPCGVAYHRHCIQVGEPFKTRLPKDKGLQMPTMVVEPTFICELCQVLALLG
jgi:hypothetical protein